MGVRSNGCSKSEVEKEENNDGSLASAGATEAGDGVGNGATEAATNINIEKTAEEVIRGKYGNGEKRKIALGSNYNAVQALVNKIIR